MRESSGHGVEDGEDIDGFGRGDESLATPLMAALCTSSLSL